MLGRVSDVSQRDGDRRRQQAGCWCTSSKIAAIGDEMTKNLAGKGRATPFAATHISHLKCRLHERFRVSLDAHAVSDDQLIEIPRN